MKSAYRIYGASSGSIIATVGLCGCDMDEIKEYILIHLKTSLWGLFTGGAALRLLREALHKFLPPNAHELVSGKLHIILTRLHDWRSVRVSEFPSKEELIQAVTCSCFLPLYFGFFPPTFRGVRYLDGELAMWRADFVSRTTITISAFAGEYDICPKDCAAAFLTFQLSDWDFQVNYFEGFTLSLAHEETMRLKPQQRGLHSRATDHEDDTKENPEIRQAEDGEERELVSVGSFVFKLYQLENFIEIWSPERLLLSGLRIGELLTMPFAAIRVVHNGTAQATPVISSI
ncbi:omega-hydroxyceramide transacylase-like [Onychostruthus taczanowskii]|uniref:omega-hydroxyceramide transacylase-like n=1 Tax=Onychostruthus taczanowskii TaxID=356909 RepID=UPI001B80B5DA|nr:omega-hydroxyceramide transacylase-like [Onychostruthus taczanowskii]